MEGNRNQSVELERTVIGVIAANMWLVSHYPLRYRLRNAC